MTLEMGLWRTEGNKLVRIEPTPVGLESQLEDFIESDPDMLGKKLLIIGRQVATAHGGFIDLLALDDTAAVHVIELKRDRTPRDVTAQTLDYGSWVSTLGREQIKTMFETYRPGHALEEAFDTTFNDTLPEEVNAEQVFTIVASHIDSATERIVRFLNENFNVPINVVFFRHFTDHGSNYLARTWLVDHEGPVPSPGAGGKKKTRETWNGTDWYVSFGDEPNGRSWADARTYGFISAGGGEWYSRTVKNLVSGARIFVNIPKAGYVGVGTVTGPAEVFDRMQISINGVDQLLKDQPLQGNYHHGASEGLAEWVVPVEWIHTVPRESAFWKRGMFANQNSVTRLRQQFTIEQVSKEFNLDS
ncbi:hypothetical protein CFAEC_04280 [Corynebacterium faecale]|uniref:endonuclease NucS domain-containing protein n=1 Tax=Corynebacterium faecale TaxID=1758466 RepID=UPI0025B3AC64|nr:endonuclease NucS domain-containing protein [Corynebacterium faecale]WJY91703.1 hypothetical protein CFAEC_04280 [Corynebacterium faecale]